jgi:HD-like signal output (HDOD) protein
LKKSALYAWRWVIDSFEAARMSEYSPSMMAEMGAQSAAFRFVAMLAGEVSDGQVELPAYPDVVVRVKNALSRDDVTPAKIAQIAATEAGLAARLMTMANSAMLNTSGTPITELKSAVVRIGYNNVRTAAVSYAVSALKQAEELKPIRKQLEVLWHEAIITSALAWATARIATGINADEAMLTGLVHNIGKVYILSRSQRMAGKTFSIADTVPIVRDWHANVGRAIVDSWKFAAHIAEAVGEHEDRERQARQADITDVLHIATRLYPSVLDPKIEVPGDLRNSLAYGRLGLDGNKVLFIIDESHEAIKTLTSALGN